MVFTIPEGSAEVQAKQGKQRGLGYVYEVSAGAKGRASVQEGKKVG